MNASIRAIIVDDEAPSRANLRLALAAFPNWQVVAECDSAEAARAACAGTPADVVFIDVQMPVEDGLDLARSLCASDAPPLLVFVTAFSRYAVDAFEVHALDYLLKPLDDQRLAQAIARAESMLEGQAGGNYARAVIDCVDDATSNAAGAGLPFLQRLSIRSVGKIEVVAVDEVLWLASAGNYVELDLGHRKVLHRVAISRLEPRLDPSQFIRLHRTVIARRTQLLELSVVSDAVYSATLRCGATVPVSPRYLAAVREAMS